MVQLLFFGGLDGIGQNMLALQHEQEIILIDAGIMFPDVDLYGIDKVLPDFSYVIENQDKIKGIFVTHGHEDHIGAIGYLLDHINVDIYGTKLSLGLVEHKLLDKGINKFNLKEINEESYVKFDHFGFSFIRVSHSIPDGVMTIIDTPVGKIVHSGDFKIDYNPVDQKVIDLNRIAELGKEGILLLMSDSTNAVKQGHTHSESNVGESFERAFKNIEGRVLVATFSSNIHRVQQAINVAKRHGRKICFAGLSMENVSKIARKLGYLFFDDEDLVFVGDVQNYPDSKLMILTTGSQGEPLAALSRIANDKYRWFDSKPGDTVIISALPIPGNEKTVYSTIDKLGRKGVRVIYEEASKMHVSGHAYAEELKLILNLIQPKFFIPIHGEYRHLAAHADLAREVESVQDVLLAENGDLIEISEHGLEIVGQVPLQATYVDGNDMLLENEELIKERVNMANDGVVTVVAHFKKNFESITNIKAYCCGVTSQPEEYLIGLQASLIDQYNNRISNRGKDSDALGKALSKMTRKYMFKRIGKRPVVIPVVLEI